MLADEADARALADVPLEDRAGVHIPERAGAGAAERVHVFRQLLQRPSQDIMVILITGVARQDTLAMSR